MRVSSQHGFTIVELLVAMALALVVFGATLTAVEAFQRGSTAELKQNENQDNARNAMDRIARTLRNVVAPTEKYAGALETAGEYSVMFQTIDTSESYSFGKNVNHTMRVRYCLDNSVPSDEVLWEQTQEWETEKAPTVPTGTACPDKSGEWKTTRQLVQNVTNEIGGQDRALFTYSASEVPQIITVGTNLYLNVDPSQTRPGETQLSSTVALRNANRKPVAKFTASLPSNKDEALLNASESYDPDGLALTYKWWENGELLPSTAQIYLVSLGKEKTYKFKLEVTNPAGLSETAEEKVTTP